jgi:5-methylcytosine-specific restriction protein A
MTQEDNILISNNTFEQLYQEFVNFIKAVSQEDFESFKKSNYVDNEENYKYLIYQEAKRKLRSSDWKSQDIGTGKIQQAVKSAVSVTVKHNSKSLYNNLINWRKIQAFSNLDNDRNLEQLFFDFYQSKISPQQAFEALMGYFDYQLIAYLFFIKDYNQFLPVSQKVFDDVIADKLHLLDFKTSRRKSWDNYKTFNSIIKQTHHFLKTRDKDATLLDAHSFLWILGKQREDWLKKSNSLKSSPTPNENVHSVISNRPETVEESPKIQVKKINIKNDEDSSKHFTPTDIIWIKNVTDHKVGQAYMDLSDEELDKFVMLFPDQSGSNLSSPKVGEIILIRQNVNDVSAFTHLVSPIDDEIVKQNIHAGFSNGRNMQVIAITPINELILASSTNWKDVYSRGNAVKIESVYKNGLIDNLQLSVWERFKPYFVKDRKKSLEETTAFIKEIESIYEGLTVTEGKLRLVSHFVRERNDEIVKLKKQQAIANNQLSCEVCNFSFRDKYNVDFIECHHRIPISVTGITETNLEDLALVCANCHRILHKKIDGKFLSITELRNRLNAFSQ